MSAVSRTVAVTGASGFIGGAHRGPNDRAKMRC
jgi:hypothetical protein